MTEESAQPPTIAQARALLVSLAADAGLTSSMPTDPAAAGLGPPPLDSRFVPYYPDAYSWVTKHYTVVYVRRLKPSERWCAHWFEHPEALMRMEALWRTWEQARLNPLTGMAGWLRDELDHHLPILHSESGPFAGCVAGEHRLPSPQLYPVADQAPDAAATLASNR